MGEMRRISVDVDGDTADAIDRLVATGDVLNETEFVRNAIEHFLDRRDGDADRGDYLQTPIPHGRDAKLGALRALIAEAYASQSLEGGFDGEDTKRRGRERLAQSRATG